MRREALGTAVLGLGTVVTGGWVRSPPRSCEPVDTSAGPGRLGGGLFVPVDKSTLLQAAPMDAIRAIVEPAFATDWPGLQGELGDATRPTLEPDDLVVGIDRGGRRRA